MNILLINHYAGSPRDGMEYRPYYLAREWVRAGHRVQIVAASFSHVRTRQPGWPRGAREGFDEMIDGISYRWLRTPVYRGNGLGRAMNIWAFLRRLWRESRHWASTFGPDVVIASSTYPMDIWVARRIARRANSTLVYEVHDLWPASPIELSGMSRRHPFIRVCQKAEDDAYRDADVVVSMLPKVADHMRAHGLDLRKLHIVPNGIALDEWLGAPGVLLPDLGPDLATALDAHRAAGRTVVGYAGSHGLPNALDVLLDAAALLLQSDAAGASASASAGAGAGAGAGAAIPPQIAIVLVGDGHEKARLAERVRREGLRNVMLFAPVPKAQIPALLARFDIAYIGWQRVPIYRFGIAPNKLMDYMMAGRAVLHSVEAGNDPVTESGCGLTVAPEAPAAVADGLRSLAALLPEARAAMGERGRAFVVAHHSYQVLAQRFIEALPVR